MATKPNPRRVPQHESVTLRRSPTQPNSSLRRRQCNSQSDNSSLLKSKLSSGETSNADHWFESQNENVSLRQTSFVGKESPFYHENSVSSPPATSLPQRPALLRYGTSASSSEEYRSVIDDLTIANKKLKRKLRKLENAQKSQPNSDKLFEVKVHGLSAEKKRELKETLRKFAESLNESPISAVNASLSGQSVNNAGNRLKASSTLSSNRPGDSGYGSMTNVGPSSKSQSGTGNVVQESLEASKNRERSIQSYLSDIPAGLFPRQVTAMTEKTKKKLVVRRLESIFAGRSATPGAHPHPTQQQEVSNSAARADKNALEASGQRYTEGKREAPIMATETEEPMDFVRTDESDQPDQHKAGVTTHEQDDTIHRHDFATSEAQHLEQRPTRPLDLDPFRAQVPAENIQYIRHLGFEVPSPTWDTESADDGWIYLNLLMNMAQLHTLNVTPEFACKAIAEHSRKLTLSNDHRKIRWHKTQDSPSSSSSSPDSSVIPNDPMANESRKRPRTSFGSTDDVIYAEKRSFKKKRSTEDSDDRFTYKPLFPPKDEDSSDDDYSMGSSASLSSTIAKAGESSALTSTIQWMRNGSQNRRHDEGPIIFYNNATFCADLTGESPRLQRYSKLIPYQCFTTTPIGQKPLQLQSIASVPQACKRPLLTTSNLEDDKDLESTSSDTELEMPRASPKHVSFAEPEQPFPFQVSGIGGVYPEDNIAITVMRQHIIDPTASPPRPLSAKRFETLLPRPNKVKQSRESVLSTRQITFKPSPLPPPLYVYNGDESEHSDDSDDASIDFDRDDYLHQRIGAQTTYHGFVADLTRSSSESNSEDESSNDDAASEVANESTVDFLASARAVDPETVRTMEREYDAAVADRLADEIPAGSSAATFGGGSGFSSPAEGMRDVYGGGGGLVPAVESNDASRWEERSIMS